MADAAISFDEIPLQIRVPYVYTEYNSTRANQGPGVQPFKALLIGQRLASGSVTTLDPQRITSAAQAAALFGEGSSLHLMAKAWFTDNTTTELWASGFGNPTGAEAEGTLVFTGPSTAAGTISLYIAGMRVQIAVSAAQTAAQIATAVAAAINAASGLPVSAAVDGSDDTQVNVTALEIGLLGNAINMRVNYYDGEALPAGTGVTITQLTGGTGAVDLTTLWPVLGDEHFNVIVCPWTDSATLAALKTELASRAGPLRQIEAVAYSWKDDTHANLGTFGDSQNEKFLTVMGMYSVPTPAYANAAAYASVEALQRSIDPARPTQTLALNYVLSPARADRFTMQENNLLLYDGIATAYTDASGIVRLQRSVTTYKENALGADDPAYLDVETLFTLSYIRWSLRNRLLLKFPRHKLANDGTRFGAGQAIVTPKTIKGEIVALFEEWEFIGLVEGADQFANDLIVSRNISDPNRVDVLLPPDLVNQLRVTAIQIQFLV